MNFMNDNGDVRDLSFEGIPDFMREYIRDYAQPLTVTAPQLSHAFQLFNVIDDLDGMLEGDELDTKASMPILFVLWTNLIARMARIETLVSAQEQCNTALNNLEDPDVEQE